MKAFPLRLVAASILFLFAPLRGDDSVYAPASGGFAVEQKLKAMVVSVDFNNASIVQATEALTEMSRELDPTHKGVGFVLQPEAVTAGRPITLKLDNVPLGETLRYVCELSGLRYRVDEHFVSILPHGTDVGLVKRTFHVDPSFVEAAQQAGAIPPSQMSP
jgi:hypothetical protein